MTTVQKHTTLVIFPEAKKVSEVYSILTNAADALPEEIRSKDAYQNTTVVIEGKKTRISTAVLFHDDINALIWGRPIEMQVNRTDRYDAYGAVAYNNKSMVNKTSDVFVTETDILECFNCSELAIEISDDEVAIMSVQLVRVSTENLKKGLQDGKSFLMPIEELKQLDTELMTSKLQVAVNQLAKV